MPKHLTAVVLSLGASALLGLGAVFARFGTRYASARTGAAISVPITTGCFWLLSPALLQLRHASLMAAALFAAVGVVFPASVTLLNFESARRLGPSIASALGTTTALFSVVLAVGLLGERPSFFMLAGTLVVMAGVALIALHQPQRAAPIQRGALLLPIAAAAIRAAAQATTKYGLSLWASPFAASLLGYSVSASLLFATRPRVGAELRAGRVPAIAWFAGAGLCNGGAVFATYAALDSGPLALVAPLTTTAPLFAVVCSAILLREERLDARLLVGVVLTVAGAALLVSR